MSSALADVRRVANGSMWTCGFRSARRGEIQRGGRAETARAHQQHARGFELLLPRDAHLRQQEVAGIAQDLFVRQTVGGHDGKLMPPGRLSQGLGITLTPAWTPKTFSPEL